MNDIERGRSIDACFPCTNVASWCVCVVGRGESPTEMTRKKSDKTLRNQEIR